ncbi:MAG: hypothetical protein ACLF0G_05020 [Candidatus Brocadiia bacterium]
MTVRDFLERIDQHPDLELVYRAPTLCIVRYTGEGGPREIRLGMWAVRRFRWDDLVRAFGIPVGPPKKKP